MAGLCEGSNEPPGSLKASKGVGGKLITLPAASEAPDSLDRPPLNVVPRCWMASAMDLLGGGVSLRTDRGVFGVVAQARIAYGSVGCRDRSLRKSCG
ncbi:hypothetical protein ANN_26797 [Periplaneta americana]|uniref:Uncharacterized protein n=1 Tax=Periplaneta americana TaxID=6978 RepID=A0ABQ8RZ69_PERAM|nr:hypothetical protein ANN_26797 [Periplaneta americana]